MSWYSKKKKQTKKKKTTKKKKQTSEQITISNKIKKNDRNKDIRQISFFKNLFIDLEDAQEILQSQITTT